MDLTDRGMAVALRTLRRVAGLDVIDRYGLREPLERAVFTATRGGGRAAGRAGRTFGKATKRLARAGG
jgi:hypothetical protein